MTHYLLKNERDRWQMCWKYIQAKIRGDNVWKKEDLPKIQPYFNWHDSADSKNRKMMTKIESEAFDYYREIFVSYAAELYNLRDSVEGFGVEDIFEIFGYEWNDNYFFDEKGCFCIDGESIDENFILPLSNNYKQISYPCIAIVLIDNFCNRCCTEDMAIIDYVELKEFQN